MKKINQNYYYYAIVVGVFLLLKLHYTSIGNDYLKFLLTPTNQLVSLIYGSTPTYSADYGYAYENLNITIEKSCSGYNFWILCFAMLSFLVIPHCKNHLTKIAAVASMLLLSWLLTVFVNTSRIATAILISQKIPASTHFPWLHQSEGIFIYLSFLISFYMILNRFLTKFKTTHA